MATSYDFKSKHRYLSSRPRNYLLTSATFAVIFVYIINTQWNFLIEPHVKGVNYAEATTDANMTSYVSPVTVAQRMRGEKKSSNVTSFRKYSSLIIPDRITGPYTSIVSILNNRHIYHLNDTIHVEINAKDTKLRRKKSGGDLFRAIIFSKESNSTASPCRFVDHDNGTYSAYFVLPWTGSVQVVVTLIYTKEVLDTFKRLYFKYPDRCFFYKGVFSAHFDNKHVTEPATCSISPFQSSLCNYTDPLIRSPFFCSRPKNKKFKCGDLNMFQYDPERSMALVKKNISQLETELLKSKRQKIVLQHLPKEIKVMQSNTQHLMEQTQAQLPYCSLGNIPADVTTAGYFYNDTWYPFDCQVRDFTDDEFKKTLSNKHIYFYGDSTCKQLYEFVFEKFRDTMKLSNTPDWVQQRNGPLLAKEVAHNFTIRFRFQGVPRKANQMFPIRRFEYIAKEIDAINAGSDTVIIISMWAHYTSTRMDFYDNRLQGILSSIKRLWERCPDTLVIFKGGNPKDQFSFMALLFSSDYYSLQIEQRLRQSLLKIRNKSLGFIDVWDLVSTHHSPDVTHPIPVIIKNVWNRILTYIWSRDQQLRGVSSHTYISPNAFRFRS